MTWDPRNSIPKQRRGVPGGSRTAPTGDQSQDTHPAPEAIPTFAATRAYQWQDEHETQMPWTHEFERELAYEGIWDPRSWEAWGKWCTRGIIPQ